MLTDARNVPSGDTIHADVCIIGARRAGISIAREFLVTGWLVCILESGDHLAHPQPANKSLDVGSTNTIITDTTPL